MKESVITVILAAACLGLVILAGVGIWMEDCEAPVIYQKNEKKVTYTEGEPYDSLLEGMYAEDSSDGDVTQSLRVSNIYVTGANKAVVVYVAKDQANNIGTFKKEIQYQENKEDDVQTNLTISSKANDGKENADRPVLSMLSTEATLKVGENFNVIRYVESATDADGSNLSRNIHIDGSYDTEQPGEYEIRVYVINSAGQKSNVEIFTLTVEP